MSHILFDMAKHAQQDVPRSTQILRTARIHRSTDFPSSARARTLRIMTAPHFRKISLATLFLWALGYALWATDWWLQPPPFALDHALRGFVVFAFGAMECLVVGRMLSRIQNLCARTGYLAIVAAVAVIVSTALLALFQELVMHVIASRWGGPAWLNVFEQIPAMSWLFVTWALLPMAITCKHTLRRTVI